MGCFWEDRYVGDDGGGGVKNGVNFVVDRIDNCVNLAAY